MEEDKSAGEGIDASLMHNLLKLSEPSQAAEAPSDLAISRLSPEDRARALDLAATLIRQARKEATGTAAAAAEPSGEEPPAKPAPRGPARAEVPADRSRVREILFRGAVYKFKGIGVAKTQDHRVGVVECWETEIETEGEEPFSLVVEEFVDGRFSPWSFDGVFFKDFVQAAIVGVVAGSFQAKWLREQWRRQHEHQRLVMVVLPLVALFAMIIGMAIGLRVG